MIGWQIVVNFIGPIFLSFSLYFLKILVFMSSSPYTDCLGFQVKVLTQIKIYYELELSALHLHLKDITWIYFSSFCAQLFPIVPG